MSWRAWLAAAMLAALSACGGGETDLGPANRSSISLEAVPAANAPVAPRRHIAATSDSTPLDADALFDWAEWKYPALFPRGPGTQVMPLNGTQYKVRAYPTGNYLGVDFAGSVFGYGPFTANALLGFGTLTSLAAQVQSDNCLGRDLGCKKPGIATHPANVHTRPGKSASFSVTASSTLPLSFQWESSSDSGLSYHDVEGASSSTYTISAASLTDDGRLVRARVSNRLGSTYTASAALRVKALGADSLFPGEVGATWTHAVSGTNYPDVTIATGNARVDGQVGTLFETSNDIDGVTSREIYVTTSTGVRFRAAPGADPIDRAFDGIVMVETPVQVGRSFEQLASNKFEIPEDIDQDGLNDSLRLFSTLTVVGLETVATSVGVFEDAVHLRQSVDEFVFLTTGGQPIKATIQLDSWRFEGIGLVKEESTISIDDHVEKEQRILTSYRIGRTRSDASAPVMLDFAPEPDRLLKGTGTVVSVSFDEPIDPLSATPERLTVTDANGRRVPGNVRADGSTFTFSPNQAWVSGTYAARLSAGITDRVGNATAEGKSWSFSIDATGLSVVSVSPSPGSETVATSASIVIEFNEPPAAESVNSKTVRLLLYPYEEVPTQQRIEGNKVVLTPIAPLQRGTAYAVRAGGVTDRVGNPLSPGLDFVFSTTQGRFAYAKQPAPYFAASAVAVGDVNGDGLIDVLAIGTWESATDGLTVLYGKPDGTLTPPTRIDIGAKMRCGVRGIAVGDFDGDGRADVALGGCGVQILRQTTSGTLVVAEYLPDVMTGILRFADVDGTGRKSLLAANGTGVSILRTGGLGTMVVERTIPAGTSAIRDLQVADLNRDGKPDIVVAFDSGSQRNIGILQGQGQGAFGTPTYLSTNSAWGATALAIGDLNGDGRPDIAATTGGNSPAWLAVFYQSASGEFGSPRQIATYDGQQSIVIADVDGDGRPDLLVNHDGWGSLGLYLQRSGGLLSSEELFRSPSGGWPPHAMVVADINQDGRPDVVAGGYLILQLPLSATSPGITAQARPGAGLPMGRSFRKRAQDWINAYLHR